MSLPGLLIEYLITGAGALVWIWLALQPAASELPSWINPTEMSTPGAALMLPLVYVAGMVVDFLGKRATSLIGRIRRSQAAGGPWRSVTIARKPKSPYSVAQIFHQSSDLGSQYEMRSSRDRIARGLMVNAGAAAIVLLLQQRALGALAASILAVVAYLMWLRFNRLTAKFGARAAQAIKTARP